LILQFARQIIIKLPNLDWEDTLSYYGAVLHMCEKERLMKFKKSVPISKITEHAVRFKDEIKKLLIEAITNCEEKA